MKLEMSSDGMNIMVRRIPRTQKIIEKKLKLQKFFNNSFTNNFHQLPIKTMQPFTVPRRLAKFGVQRTFSKIRGSISEIGKYGVN